MLMPLQARATLIVVPDTADLLSASDAVVVGKVQTIRSGRSANSLRTDILVDVEDVVKGHAVGPIDVVEPGGAVGNRQRWIHGAPTFFVGERALLFLQRNQRGELETTFLGAGKFSVVRSGSGTEFAVRNLNDARVFSRHFDRLEAGQPVTSYELKPFLRTLRSMVGPDAGAVLESQPMRATAAAQWQENFTFSGPPLTRWFSADEGTPIGYSISEDGDVALGRSASVEAADAALAAWSNTSCANLTLVDVGAAPPASFNECDGRTEITFDDPFSELPDPVNCAGVLGVGGVCGDTSSPESFNGALFYPITEGDVVVNNGFEDCPFWNAQNLAELLTHEVGHTLGLAHSSDDPGEPDPSLRDATMYYAAHFDGRGASLMSDDIAAICALYPTGRTGSVAFRRFAIVADPSRPPPSDRLVVDGTLSVDNGGFDPNADTLIIDLLSGGTSVYRLAILPGQWVTNVTGTRLLYRRVTAAGATTLRLSGVSRGALRLRVRARGLDLTAVQASPLVMSLALGRANVTETVPFLQIQSR